MVVVGVDLWILDEGTTQDRTFEEQNFPLRYGAQCQFD